jgi:hypothetical protein
LWTVPVSGVWTVILFFIVLCGTAEGPRTRWFIYCSQAVNPLLFGGSKKSESERSFP